MSTLVTDSVLIGSSTGMPLAGTPVSGSPLEIHSTTFLTEAQFSHSDTFYNAPALTLAHSRGTQTSPTAVKNGDYLGYFNLYGFDGTGYGNGVQLNSQANADWNSTNRTACLTVTAVLSGQNSASEAFRFGDQAGNNISSFPLVLSEAGPHAVIGWATSVNATINTGFSKLSAGIVAIGNGSVGDFSGSLKLATLKNKGFTVATLPSGAEGDVSYATNGRKVGELSGLGTGVPVYFSNGAWRVFSTDAAVSA
jgi:hypothetical protein